MSRHRYKIPDKSAMKSGYYHEKPLVFSEISIRNKKKNVPKAVIRNTNFIQQNYYSFSGTAFMNLFISFIDR